ncbi:MAG: M14 family metallopeptidase [Bacteroidales bacterium]
MKISLLIFSLFCFSLSLIAQDTAFLTYYEKSGCVKTPRYSETIDFCKKLDKASALLHYTTFGTSPQGRDLPLLIADKNGNFTPEAVRKSGKAVLLIQACIHAGESDGKDAGLMLLRDMIINKKGLNLLEHVTILFIPILNTDGHERFGPYNRINQNGPDEMGWRTTSQNLNLNRDFMKADAPEMQAWLKLYNAWLPEFFVDCHVTDGADFQYTMTYALETKGNLEKDLSDWTSKVCETFLVDEMKKSGFPVFPYVQFRNWHDPRSGLTLGVAPPMLSQGYTAVQNRPGLLIETHMLKPYKVRVNSTYTMLTHTLKLLNTEYKTLQNLVKEADAATASEKFRKEPFPVNFSESFADSTAVEFLGFEYTIDTSDLTGGLWFKYDNKKPTNWQLIMYPNCKADKFVKLPEAYLIPPQCIAVIERMKLHGIKTTVFKNEVTCKVKSSWFRNPRWQQRSYEGHHKLTFEIVDTIEKRTFPNGTVLVEMNQRTARVIAHLLEPGSPDSFAAWGFFDAFMEQKEYSESYVMETMAREMIRNNPTLKQEFDQKKASDKAFASDADAQLNWFYSKSPYWDSRFNQYPVGRILDKDELELLKD